MKHRIYLASNVARNVNNEIVSHVDVYGYSASEHGTLIFWLDEKQEKTGFYFLADVRYVLPIELK